LQHQLHHFRKSDLHHHPTLSGDTTKQKYGFPGFINRNLFPSFPIKQYTPA
jgi:hypothetical protein